MILFKGKPLFVVPKRITMREIEFNVFDSQGNLLGTNVLGISMNTHYTEQERYELEEFIQDITLDLEVKLKFLKEFGVEISNWESLKKTKEKEEIVNIMSSKWNIPEKLMNRYLV